MSEAEPETFEIELDQQELYRFLVVFGHDQMAPLVMDEPVPRGAGAGPNPSRLLAAAVGHCLSASALYCLDKAHIPVHGVHTTVAGREERNERGRLRIGGLQVHIDLVVADSDRSRMSRCLELFEDFCVVTASVRDGIPVRVEIDSGPQPNGDRPS